MLETLDSDAPVFEAPRDDLQRQVSFRADRSDDGLSLNGYAAVFNEWTTIDSWEGKFRERISNGAFRKTLSERTPVLQFDHGTHPVIGSIPLGRISSIFEDEHGLRVQARLHDNWMVEPVRDAIREGSIDGMSFRFRVVGETWAKGDDKIPERTITEIALYEVGPVVFPAYEQTSVGVRSRDVCTALADPDVRAEVAMLLASGTDSVLAAESPQPDEPVRHSSTGTSDELAAESPHMDEPASRHSSRTKTQRRALARLTLGD